MTKKRTTKPKPVTITTLADLANTANPENMKRLYADLGLWLVSIIALRESGLTDGRAYMIWTDDGKNELTGVNITMKHPKE